MVIGDRLRQVREQKDLSQGDIEKKTGLLRCYLSRCENNHTVPMVGTLEKWAGALDIPLYKLFYDGDKPPKPLKLAGEKRLASNGHDKNTEKFRPLLAKMNKKDQNLLILLAAKFAKEKESKSAR